MESATSPVHLSYIHLYGEWITVTIIGGRNQKDFHLYRKFDTSTYFIHFQNYVVFFTSNNWKLSVLKHCIIRMEAPCSLCNWWSGGAKFKIRTLFNSWEREVGYNSGWDTKRRLGHSGEEKMSCPPTGIKALFHPACILPCDSYSRFFTALSTQVCHRARRLQRMTRPVAGWGSWLKIRKISAKRHHRH